MSIHSKMTILADKIRELSGTATAKSIDAMTLDINAANTEIAEQAELLEQIIDAFDKKADGFGGVTLPNLDNPASATDILSGKEAIDEYGNKITGSIAIKDEAIYTPGTSNQAISGGIYLTGTQIIEGDANLVADNIKNGTSIFGVTGTYKGDGSGSGESEGFKTCTLKIQCDETYFNNHPNGGTTNFRVVYGKVYNNEFVYPASTWYDMATDEYFDIVEISSPTDCLILEDVVCESIIQITDEMAGDVSYSTIETDCGSDYPYVEITDNFNTSYLVINSEAANSTVTLTYHISDY